MTSVPVRPLARFVLPNSSALTDEGHYAYVGPTSTTLTLANTSSIGDDQDDQVYWLDHCGGDASIVTLNISGSDRLYDPTITGALVQTLNSNLVSGQTRTSIQMIKGDRLQLTKQARLLLPKLIRDENRIYSIPAATAAYTGKYYDNLVVMDASTQTQTFTLPPIDGFLINGTARTLEVFLGAQSGSFKGTIAAGLNVAAAAQNILSATGSATSFDLTATGQKARFRPINATTWALVS